MKTKKRRFAIWTLLFLLCAFAVPDLCVHAEAAAAAVPGAFVPAGMAAGTALTDLIAQNPGSFLMLFVAILLVVAAGLCVIVVIKAQEQAKVRALMYQDSVTGHLNYNKFKEDAKKCLETKKEGTALLYLDIDKFKYINDMFGYAEGDKILCELNRLLSEWTEQGELFARISADNFTALIRYRDITSLCGRLDAFLGRCDELEEGKYQFSVSVGVSLCEGDEDADLLTFVDQANYARSIAKSAGGSTYVLYEREFRETVKREKEIEGHMRAALENGEFAPYFQPKVDITDEACIGAEALARWQLPGGRLVPPGEFIPIFEKNGFITELDLYLFEEVCRLLARRMKQRAPVCPVACNFSRLHFMDNQFPDKLKFIADHYHVPTRLLELEITESIAVENTAVIAAFTKRLKGDGFLVAIDDFGAGYSSLSILRELPVDVIKLDRGFLSGKGELEKRRTIVKNVVSLARELGMQVVCEGVETAAQVGLLRQIGCRVAQGFYYAQPMPMEEFEAQLDRGLRLRKRDYEEACPAPGEQAAHKAEYSVAGTRRGEQALLRQMLESKTVELERKHRDLRVITDNLPGGILYCRNDADYTILQVGGGFLSMFGYAEEDLPALYDNKLRHMIHPDDWERVVCEMERQVRETNTESIEYRIRKKDGGYLWVLERGELIRDENGETYFCCVVLDADENKRQTENLRLTLERLQTVMRQTNDIVFETNLRERTTTVSDNWSEVFPSPPIGAIDPDPGVSGRDVHPEDRGLLQEMGEGVLTGKHYQEYELRLKCLSGVYRWFRLRLTALYAPDGTPVRLVGVLIDIDSEKRRSQRLLDRVQRDPLTNLYNKAAVRELIVEYLAAGDAKGGALLMIDIDDFKRFNDTMGHLFGDAVLVDIARCIAQPFRASDIVGRLGGDEFIVFMKDVEGGAVAGEKAAAIVAALEKLARDNGYQVSCSVGIALYPAHGVDFRGLYEKADDALYQAKSKGKNRYMVYSDDFEEARVHGALLEGESAEALPETRESESYDTALMVDVFHRLYTAEDTLEAMDPVLRMIGRRMDVSRVYIFERSQDGNTFSNTFEWCGEGVEPQRAQLQCVPLEQMFDAFLSHYDEKGIFYCKDVDLLPPEEGEFLRAQGIRSMLQCEINDNGAFRGFVGFDECRMNRYWTREQVYTLQLFSEVVGMFLLKKRSQDALQRHADDIQTVLDQQDLWVYVVEPETFRLLFINRKTLSLQPGASVGECCHKLFFGRDAPCEVCPIRALERGDPARSLEIYNPQFRVWSLAEASRIPWGDGRALLVTCYDVTRYKEQPQAQDP